MTLDYDRSRAVPAQSGLGRRSLLQGGALVLGAGLLGMNGASAASADPTWPGADGTGAGGDGAPPPPGTPPNRISATPTSATSYNGWTVGTPASAIGVQNYTVPGTSVMLQIRSGDVATVLLYVAQRFNAEVETLIKGQCGGYDYRPNVNNPSVWSNHASGTAIDLNWSKHPNGVKGTYTAPQTAAVRKILDFCDGVVYWGEDYRGTVDGMHFEINVPPGSPKLSQLVGKINGDYADPLGNLDVVAYKGKNTVQVRGWAWDPDQPTTEINVAVYVDGVGISWFPTGRSRPDVNGAFGITGNHGFDISLQMSPGDHSVTVFAINVGGGTNLPIGTKTVTVGANPRGTLDAVSTQNNSARLTGWAYDPDDPTAEISVAVYRDGVGISWFPTGQPRPDVNSAMGIDGNHGFDLTIDTTPGPHNFTVYAINVGGGDGNPAIGSKDVVVPASPTGVLDELSSSGSTVRLAGWALDLDQPDTEISVAVYRNGVGVSWFPTGVARPDVDAAFGVGGDHGFDISIPNIPSGIQTFDVFAINVGPAGDNPLIATRSVRVRG